MNNFWFIEEDALEHQALDPDEPFTWLLMLGYCQEEWPAYASNMWIGIGAKPEEWLNVEATT